MTRRVASRHYVAQCFGWCVPMGVLGIGLGWLWSYGYPALGLIGIALVLLACRILFVAVLGGIQVSGSRVESKGIFRSQRVDRSTILAVQVHRVRGDQPEGWFDTTTSPVRIRGITFRHPHSILAASPCVACAEWMAILSKLAQDLNVQLIDDAPRP